MRAVTNVTLKSGTNRLHGAAFWYVRNDAFSARNFFDTSGRPSPDKQNEPGFVLGGPVYIPKVYNGKNKTFFFTSLDIYRYRTASSGQIGTVPTPLMRSGNFSELAGGIFDPLTTRPNGSGGFVRDQFPGNVIPQNRLSPISLNFQKGYKLPTRPGTQLNWVGIQAPTLVDKDQFYVKIDHNISNNHRLSFAYESVAYWHDGRIGAFMLNITLNNALCLVAVLAGIRLHRG